MIKRYLIKSKRLGLRNWTTADLIPFIEMCQDQEVMKYFPKLLSKDECKSFMERMQEHFSEHGFCYFAVDILKTDEFIGFTGMSHQNYESKFTPCIDIGWRLKKRSWGNGYATEAAITCLKFAANNLNLKEIYSITSKVNRNSINVMKKIGMDYHSTFQHPALLQNKFLKDCDVYHTNL